VRDASARMCASGVSASRTRSDTIMHMRLMAKLLSTFFTEAFGWCVETRMWRRMPRWNSSRVTMPLPSASRT
jgi:hypothetical protein